MTNTDEEIILQSQDDKRRYQLYKDHIEHLELFKEAIEKMIRPLVKDVDGNMVSAQSGLSPYGHAKALIELDEVNAKLPVLQYNLKLTEGIVNAWPGILQRESKECNEQWDVIYPKACQLADEFMGHPIAALVSFYQKHVKFDDAALEQEYKNMNYYAFKRHVAEYERTHKEIKKTGNGILRNLKTFIGLVQFLKPL